MIDLDCYTSSISLQKSIECAHREFRDDVKELMSYNPDDTKDWKNCIRRCQFCGEVWVKVSGCEGQTTCGSRDTGKDFSAKAWYNYHFHVDSSGKRSWRKDDDDEKAKVRKQLDELRLRAENPWGLIGLQARAQ